jgi:hypothetical protein
MENNLLKKLFRTFGGSNEQLICSRTSLRLLDRLNVLRFSIKNESHIHFVRIFGHWMSPSQGLSSDQHNMRKRGLNIIHIPSGIRTAAIRFPPFVPSVGLSVNPG